MQATAAQATTEVSEFLSWEEICARHPNEWVVLVDTVFECRVIGARVYGHHPDRAAHLDILQAAVDEQRCPMSCWTGRPRDHHWKWIRVYVRD